MSEQNSVFDDHEPGVVHSWEDLSEDRLDFELEDRLGSLEEGIDGEEFVLTHSSRGRSGAVEMMRFNRSTRLLRIFPRIIRLGSLHDQFDRIKELQLEAPCWDPDDHSVENDRYGLLQARGLPRGFATFYEYGLGIKRDYRDIIDEIERHTQCSIVRFTSAITEGPIDPDSPIFVLSLQRFDGYRAAVDRSRARGQTAVRRVIDAECHNHVADLFGLERVEPRYGRNGVIQRLTEEVQSGYVLDSGDRAAIIEEARRNAKLVAREMPTQFNRLRDDIRLVSLETLIAEYRDGLDGPHANNEAYWQRFFSDNGFALQQIFSMPVVVVLEQAHIQAPDASGRGGRIADFLCANTITRTALIVEIKTPSTPLMEAREYRGAGNSAVYAPHKELSGAVSQVQSQMAAVPQDLAQRLPRTMNIEIDPWNDVRGAVIAGRIGRCSDEQRASFVRYRAGLSTVQVLGYDEILDQLESLHRVLKAASQDNNS